jgi:hypothetical protein
VRKVEELTPEAQAAESEVNFEIGVMVKNDRRYYDDLKARDAFAQKWRGNAATAQSALKGDIAQILKDVELGRLDRQTAQQIVDEATSAGFMPQLKREQWNTWANAAPSPATAPPASATPPAGAMTTGSAGSGRSGGGDGAAAHPIDLLRRRNTLSTGKGRLQRHVMDAGEARPVDQQGYVEHMKNVVDEFAGYANADNTAEIAADLESYKQAYLKRYKALLHARSREISAWVSGPSKYPGRQQAKIMDHTDKLLNEFVEWDASALKRMRQSYNPKMVAKAPIKSGDADAIAKIQAKLTEAETLQQRMVDANKIVRSKKLTRRAEGAAVDGRDQHP